MALWKHSLGTVCMKSMKEAYIFHDQTFPVLTDFLSRHISRFQGFRQAVTSSKHVVDCHSARQPWGLIISMFCPRPKMRWAVSFCQRHSGSTLMLENHFHLSVSLCMPVCVWEMNVNKTLLCQWPLLAFSLIFLRMRVLVWGRSTPKTSENVSLALLFPVALPGGCQPE